MTNEGSSSFGMRKELRDAKNTAGPTVEKLMDLATNTCSGDEVVQKCINDGLKLIKETDTFPSSLLRLQNLLER